MKIVRKYSTWPLLIVLAAAFFLLSSVTASAAADTDASAAGATAVAAAQQNDDDTFWSGLGTDYFRAHMDAQERALYDSLKSSAEETLRDGSSTVTEVRGGYQGTSSEKAFHVATIFKACNPQYFFLSPRVRCIHYSYIDGSSDYEIRLTVAAAYQDGAARAKMKGVIQANSESILAQARKQPTAAGRLKVVQKLLSARLTYDNDDSRAYDEQAADSALAGTRTVCAGYSAGFALLANALGYETFTVTGADHKWNETRLGSRWYMTDVTWDDQDRNDAAGEPVVSMTYFLTKEDSSHVPESFWAQYGRPACAAVYSGDGTAAAESALSQETTGASGTASSHVHQAGAARITPATLTANGRKIVRCSSCGAQLKSTVIYRPKTFRLSTSAYTYSGAVRKPAVTVTDAAGRKLSASAYTLSYSGNRYVGTATVTVRFRGSYRGTKKLTFRILPRGTRIRSLSSGRRCFTVRWALQRSQTSGYQIRCSRAASMSKAAVITVAGSGTASRRVLRRTAGTWYVQVRTYRVVGKKKYYSGWSARKAVRVK